MVRYLVAWLALFVCGCAGATSDGIPLSDLNGQPVGVAAAPSASPTTSPSVTASPTPTDSASPSPSSSASPSPTPSPSASASSDNSCTKTSTDTCIKADGTCPDDQVDKTGTDASGKELKCKDEGDTNRWKSV